MELDTGQQGLLRRGGQHGSPLKRHLQRQQRDPPVHRLPRAAVAVGLPALGQPGQHRQRPDREPRPSCEGRGRLAHPVHHRRTCQRHEHGRVLQAGSEGAHQRVSVCLVVG